MEAKSLSIAPGRRRTRRRAFLLVAFVVLLEVTLLMPFVDHLADTNQTIHFTQHGFIFAGGVLLGLALRDVQRTSRR
jgi:peptidoglycan/LPS O-acetylase OafA/YrhL